MDGQPDTGQQPSTPWTSSGNPAADYRELLRIFQGGLAERRAGRDADAFVAQNMGGGDENPQTMAHLASLVAYVASKGGEPQSPSDAATGIVGTVGQKMLLGQGNRFLSPGEQAPITQFQQQNPKLAAGLKFVGGIPPYAAASFSGNPWLAGLGAAGAGAVEASSEPGATPTSIGGSAALSGLTTLATAGMLHGMAARVAPAAEGGELLLERAAKGLPGSGPAEAKILAEAERLERLTPGVPPLLAEINPRLAKVATRGAPLTVPEIQGTMVQTAHDAWEVARQAKQAVGAKYAQLNTPLTDPRVAQVLGRPEVQTVANRLRDAGALPEAAVPGFFPAQETTPLTGTMANDLRLELQSQLKRLRVSMARNPQQASLGAQATRLQDAAGTLRTVLKENVPDFEKIQAEYGPYAERESTRRDIFRRLAGQDPRPGQSPASTMPPGRGTGMLEPPATSLSGQLGYHLAPGGVRGGKEFQKLAMAEKLGPIMLRPAKEAVHALGKLWPGFVSPYTRALPGAGSAMSIPAMRGLLAPTQPADATATDQEQ